MNINKNKIYLLILFFLGFSKNFNSYFIHYDRRPKVVYVFEDEYYDYNYDYNYNYDYVYYDYKLDNIDLLISSISVSCIVLCMFLDIIFKKREKKYKKVKCYRRVI